MLKGLMVAAAAALLQAALIALLVAWATTAHEPLAAAESRALMLEVGLKAGGFFALLLLPLHVGLALFVEPLRPNRDQTREPRQHPRGVNPYREAARFE